MFADDYFTFQADNVKSRPPAQSSKASCRFVTRLPKPHELAGNLEKGTDFNEAIMEEWRVELEWGYQVLIYGVGCKTRLVDRFIEKHLADVSVLRVFNWGDLSTNHDCQVVVIEGVERGVRWSQVLSMVGDGCWLFMTMDGVHSPPGLGEQVLYHPVHTFIPHPPERFLSLAAQTTRGHDVAGSEVRLKAALFVLQSLGSTAANLFKLLAEHQPQSHLQWFRRALEAFIVSNEMAFRTQLTEFIDHDLIILVQNDEDDHGMGEEPRYRTVLESEDLAELIKLI